MRSRERSDRLAAFDEALRREAGGHIAGIDEAGRGPLAGPVVAAAVVLPPGMRIDGVDDSKRLNEKQREETLARIEEAALAIGVGIVGPRRIDSINILQATLLAAQKAIRMMNYPVKLLMTDYLKVDTNVAPVRAEAKADGKSLSVAAASIVAKTARDRMMAAYAEEYPEYGLERNKGYGSNEHLKALDLHGPSSLHRMSFRGIGLFSESIRPSASFLRLRRLYECADRSAFEKEAERLLRRSECPLVECERRQAGKWLETGR
jgi:ribonuclease HII